MLGSIVQGVSGVGGGFIMMPLLALINVAWLPGPFVFATLSISGVMMWRERSHIDIANTWAVLAAMVPGSLAGAWLLTRVPKDDLGILFGSVIMLAVLISLTGFHVRLNRVSGSICGFFASAMGASTGIGGPVLAVLYQRATGPTVRSTLAYLYTLASLIILVALALNGRFGLADASQGLLLVPGFLLGYLCSRPLTNYFDHGWTRYIVLGVSAAAAISLIGSSL
jgi:uncharacterized membrane protein YfcA